MPAGIIAPNRPEPRSLALRGIAGEAPDFVDFRDHRFY